MQKHTITTYSFNELSEASKSKALEYLREINIEHSDWCAQDGLLDLSSEEIKQIGVTMSKEWYNSDKPKNARGNIIGEYPAHTGLIGYADHRPSEFDLESNRYIQFDGIEINDREIFLKFLNIPPEIGCKVEYCFINEKNTNTKIVFTDDNMNELDTRPNTILGNATDIWNAKVNEALQELKKQYEYNLTDEAVIETIEANEYNFYEDGSISNL